jgi:hypothetical protein
VLAGMELADPKLAAARARIDEAIEAIEARARVQPEIDAAKRAAVLDLLHQAYLAKDQVGLNNLIISATFRGYQLADQDLLAQMTRCPADVVSWWQGPCDLP